MRGNWKFVDAEEIFDTLGINIIGLLTNGEKFLFFHVLPEPGLEKENCYIFSSMMFLYEHIDEEVCYPYTAENDKRVLNALNSLGDDYSRIAGEDSILREIIFER